jgi:transcriptional regulator with XRE-family HTH domain
VIARVVDIPRSILPEERFPARLRRLRLARAWSQQRLAEHASLDRQTVWGAERGTDVHAWVLERLADALETTMDALWRGEK